MVRRPTGRVIFFSVNPLFADLTVGRILYDLYCTFYLSGAMMRETHKPTKAMDHIKFFMKNKLENTHVK